MTESSSPPESSYPPDLQDALDESLIQEERDREQIEAKLGLPIGYFESMKEAGSDWEFSIKLVVLLEAALGHVLAAQLQNDAVKRHCERLNLSGGRVSKLGLAEDLGVLTDAERKSFTVLADIRNTFAHRVENIGGNLESFARQLTDNTYESMVRAILMVPPEMVKDVRFLWAPKDMHAWMFRTQMWLGATLLLTALAKQDRHASAEAQRRKDLEAAAEAHKKGEPFTLEKMFSLPDSPQAKAAMKAFQNKKPAQSGPGEEPGA